jgi:hypothetical protein
LWNVRAHTQLLLEDRIPNFGNPEPNITKERGQYDDHRRFKAPFLCSVKLEKKGFKDQQHLAPTGKMFGAEGFSCADMSWRPMRAQARQAYGHPEKDNLPGNNPCEGNNYYTCFGPESSNPRVLLIFLFSYIP